MPPKQKTKQLQDFIECDICHCIFDARDSSMHSNKTDSQQCFNDLVKFTYGFVCKKTIFAKIQVDSAEKGTFGCLKLVSLT